MIGALLAVSGAAIAADDSGLAASLAAEGALDGMASPVSEIPPPSVRLVGQQDGQRVMWSLVSCIYSADGTLPSDAYADEGSFARVGPVEGWCASMSGIEAAAIETVLTERQLFTAVSEGFALNLASPDIGLKFVIPRKYFCGVIAGFDERSGSLDFPVLRGLCEL